VTQSLILKIKGLFTSLNEYSEVPEGALLEADNVDILKDSIAEPRRGFDRLSAGYSNASHRTDRSWFYQDKQFGHHGTYGSAGTLSYLDAGTWSSAGSYSAPSGARMRDLQANQNLYFSTASGIYKLDAYNATPKLAGAYKGLDLQAAISASASTWLAQNYRVAYRIVWGYKDANGNLILGAPSARESFKNTGAGTKAVDITTTIPAGVTTEWFYQLYRSAAVDNTSADTEPNDELGLVYEGNPTAGEITAGTVTITDITPDALRGATIYTAATQDGLANQNERPPLAKDMAVFRDTVFFAYTVSKHRYYLTLLAVGSPNGIVANDTVTIGGVTYTAKASETIASAQFQVVTAGSASQNIRDTALSLVRVINRHSSSTVYAYYLSGPDDLPGQILLEERSIGGASFAVTSSRSTCWNPSLPSSGTAESSENDTFKNGLAWSKPGQPEAVPLVNTVTVGSKDAAILRIVPLKDALFIFKEDGIFKLTGYAPNFTVELFDSSAVLLAAESPAILNNQIFCLTDQGVTVVSDGVKVISRPIEQDLLELIGASLSGVQTLTWGIGYETERKYMLFMISGASDTYPTQAWVYNVFTSSWVRHVLNATCGVVEEKRLYIAHARSNYILRDRKNYSYLDYADFYATTSITTVNGTTLTLNSGTDELAVGDVIYQSSTVFSLVSAVDTVAGTVTVEANPGFSVAAVDLLKAIDVRITWAPITGGNPGVLKQYHTATPLFKNDFYGTGYLVFVSDLSQFEEQVPITGLGVGTWGLFAWGETPWGGVTGLRRPVRQWVPRDKQRASALTISFRHAFGFSPWQIQGLALFGTPGTERIGK
jgi:hypothetical protein